MMDMRAWWMVVLLAVTLAGAADPADPAASNTVRLSVGGPGAASLDLEVTYLSEPVLQALFGSEETRTRVRAAAAGQHAFLVQAAARRPTEFFPTSFAFSQGRDRLEPKRSGVVALDGGFGGRLDAGDSTRGLVLVAARLDLAKPVTIEYSSSSQAFQFPSSEPLQGAVRPEGLQVDPIQALEWKVQDLERRLKAVEEKLQSSSP